MGTTPQHNSEECTSSSTSRDKEDNIVDNNDNIGLTTMANDPIQLRRPRHAYEAYSSSYSAHGSQSDIQDDSDSNYEGGSRQQSASPSILSPSSLRDHTDQGTNDKTRLLYCLRARDKRPREDNDTNTQYQTTHMSSLRSSATVSAIISSSEDDDEDEDEFGYPYTAPPLRKKPRLEQQQLDVVNASSIPFIDQVSPKPLSNLDQSTTDRDQFRYSLMDPNEAIEFLTRVKYALDPGEYNRFLDIMRAAKSDSLPTAQIVDSISKIFRGQRELVVGFNRFLPPGYRIIYIPGIDHKHHEAEAELLLDEFKDHRGPFEFQLAYNFMIMLKKQLANKPDVYGSFVKTLKDYEAKRLNGKDVFDIVKKLFADEPKLIREFKKFITHSDGEGESIDALGEVYALKRKQRRQLSLEEEMALVLENGQFFERVRRYINNQVSHQCFLELVNLFNQGIIGVKATIKKAADFLKGDPALLDEFKHLISYGATMPVADGVMKTNGHTNPAQTITKSKDSKREKRTRMKLSNDPGPSYRLISKQADSPTCSGRDALCSQVLNDNYASHPIWASEDGGFIASKKNQAEENLHKVEEQRYNLDRLIDSGTNLLGLLTQMSDAMAKLSPKQRSKYEPPAFLGAGTMMAYKLAIERLYPKEANKIAELLQANPSQTVSPVLKLLKTKLEEWKKKKASSEKAWKEAERDSYYKALDISSGSFKNIDKKIISNKSLITEIECLHFERRDDTRTDPPHMTFHVCDRNVVSDIGELLSLYITSRMDYGLNTIRTMKKFISKFINSFMSGSPPSPKDENQNKVNGFVANDTLYCFTRLFQILYERFETMKDIAKRYDQDPEGTKERYRAELDVKVKKVKHNGVNLTFSEGYYATLLDLVREMIRNGIDPGDFEACARYIFGVEGYKLFTVDKVLHALCLQANHAVTDPDSRDLMKLYADEGEGLPSATLDTVSYYYLKAKEIQSKTSRLYILFAFTTPEEANKCTVSITLMTPEDEIGNERIKSYEDYVAAFKNMGEETSTTTTTTVLGNHARPPFLRRNLQSIPPGDVDTHSGLEHKICLHTYKLFYVIGTEDYMYMPRRRERTGQ